MSFLRADECPRRAFLPTYDGTTFEVFRRRTPEVDLPPPAPALCACITVPVRDEAARLPVLVEALAAQRALGGGALPRDTYEVLLLLNNCRDGSAACARRLQRRHPSLRLHVLEAELPPSEAHVGRARQILMDTACRRFRALGRPRGVILSTDADSAPALDWVAQTLAEVARGADGVGGRVQLFPAERAALRPAVRRLLLLDVGYRRFAEALFDLYVPNAHDPWPRHHQHFGASLAVTAAGYARAGGLPAVPSSEDVALYRAVREAGGRFRHSDRVRVYTAARASGRAQGGMAAALSEWEAAVMKGQPVRAESAARIEQRAAAAARQHARGEGLPATAFAEDGGAHGGAPAQEVRAALRDLKALVARLRTLTPAERLERAYALGRAAAAPLDSSSKQAAASQPVLSLGRAASQAA